MRLGARAEAKPEVKENALSLMATQADPNCRQA